MLCENYNLKQSGTIWDNLMVKSPPLISLEVLKSGSLTVCQSGSLAVVFRGIDGIVRISVAVVVSGICGI